MDKVFSIEKNTLHISSGDIILVESRNGELIDIATTDENYASIYGIHLLPSTLIRKPKTDEELAEEEFPYYKGSEGRELAHQYGFIKGRESVGGEFHLTREQVEKLIGNARSGASKSDGYYFKFTIDNLISSLTPPIYPHTITVQTDHKGNHLWNTLVPEY